MRGERRRLWTRALAALLGPALSLLPPISTADAQAAEPLPEPMHGQAVEPARQTSQAVPRPAPVVDPIERVARREVLLTERASAAALRARLSAFTAYRLTRRSSARFLVAPEARGKDARARSAALLVLRRHAQEASTLERERARTAAERLALERAAAAFPVAEEAPAPDKEAASDELAAGEGSLSAPVPAAGDGLLAPARGPVVARPGVRRDPATTAMHRVTGLEVLYRLNQPVLAPAAGTVRRVEPLPQGGFAVVLHHARQVHRVSVLTGFRRVDVAPGDSVDRGQPLGICGRNLDGAPMVAFELWRAGVPVHPGSMLAEAQALTPPGHKPRKAQSSSRRSRHPRI